MSFSKFLKYLFLYGFVEDMFSDNNHDPKQNHDTPYIYDDYENSHISLNQNLPIEEQIDILQDRINKLEKQLDRYDVMDDRYDELSDEISKLEDRLYVLEEELDNRDYIADDEDDFEDDFE